VDREDPGSAKERSGEKRSHQQQMRVLYAPVRYPRPTYATFDLTVSFNALLPSSRKS